MTVGIVLSSVPGYSETFFRNKINGLQQNGINVILFVDMFSHESIDLPCKIVSAPNFGKTIFSRLKASMIAFKSICMYPKRSIKLYQLDKKDGVRLKNRIKNLLFNQYLLSQKLDWLHFGYGMLASNRENVAEAIGSKMAVSFRGFDLYLSPLKHKGCYDKLFSKDVKYHVLSQKMKQNLVSYNISEANIKVITPAINTHLFQEISQDHTSRKVVNITCISRLHWVKGINYLFEALSILKQNGIDFKFTVIGDGEEKERLVFSAHQFGILNEVIFTGKLPQKEVVTYLKKTDIYVQYSIQEGFGNAVLEAQAMGIFCIVSDADGLQENILHEKTGLVVPKRNPKALAKAIEYVHGLDAKKKQSITKCAIDRVRNDFNLEKQNTLFFEFYRK
ncbi:hypothetical protein A9Q86_05050 [Flavobacteriales bacterium 33_180_T64]|nr:hypothetical protein A9Q86_05050 [Flavobacteriales bacterium 33_180_T64]